jgi:ABC-type antimicrobial peptide transport system permease subunit
MSERPVGSSGNLSLFGIRLTGLPIVSPPPSRSPLFPDTWAYVRADLLAGMDLVHGGSVQAILTNASLDSSTVSRFGLTRMDAVGAVGFVRAGVAQIQTTLQLLAVVIGLVIALLVYAAMSLEVHARAREIATLRSLGATPRRVAAVYEAQAVLISLVGVLLGAALGIVVAHAVVSFAPLFGFPNLVILAPPLRAIGLTLVVALVAAVLAGLVPSRRAAVLVRSKGANPS